MISSLDPFGAAERLALQTVPVRLRIRWPRLRKPLDRNCSRSLAEAFRSRQGAIAVDKRLFDTRHAAFRGVTAVRAKAADYWRRNTLPFAAPAVRLVELEQLTAFDAQLAAYYFELQLAVGELDLCYSQLVQEARQRLGELFDAADYPGTLDDQFAIDWHYVAMEPPAHLGRASPLLYDQQVQRTQHYYCQAVHLADTALATELARWLNDATARPAAGSAIVPATGNAAEQGSAAVPVVRAGVADVVSRFQRLGLPADRQLAALLDQVLQLDQVLHLDQAIHLDSASPLAFRQRCEREQEPLQRIASRLQRWVSGRPASLQQSLAAMACADGAASNCSPGN